MARRRRNYTGFPSKFYDFKFKSLSELSNFIDSTPTKGIFKGELTVSNSETERVKSFSGTESFDQANGYMLGGWRAGAESVAAYMAKSKAGRNGVSPKTFNSVVGFAPCVPAYLSGNPLNMYNQTQAPNRKRIVSITYNIVADFSISAESIQQTAAKLFNVIVGLEKQGINTELYVCAIARRDSEQIFWATCIKQAARPFNLLSAVYPFTNPSMLRRHHFAITERAGVKLKGWQGTYGCAVANSTAAECKRVGIPAENVFSYYSLKDKSEKEIAEMLK